MEVIGDADVSVQAKMPIAGRLSEVSELINSSCELHGVNRRALEKGCRRKECSKVRKELAVKLMFEMGLTYAETAPMLGLSASAVSKILKAMDTI